MMDDLTRHDKTNHPPNHVTSLCCTSCTSRIHQHSFHCHLNQCIQLQASFSCIRGPGSGLKVVSGCFGKSCSSVSKSALSAKQGVESRCLDPKHGATFLWHDHLLGQSKGETCILQSASSWHDWDCKHPAPSTGHRTFAGEGKAKAHQEIGLLHSLSCEIYLELFPFSKVLCEL